MTSRDVPSSNGRLLVVFTRCPDLGACKTRLIPVLGVDRATAIHAALVRQTMRWVSAARDAGMADVEVNYAGEHLEGLKAICDEGNKIDYRQQAEGDLGVRLTAAFERAFQRGYSKVAIIGTDCPELDSSHISLAYEYLDQADIVVGPAVDGGYYLIALRRAEPQLFEHVAWGDATVFETTLAKAKHLRLNVALLPKLADIDRVDDLKRWKDFHLTETKVN